MVRKKFLLNILQIQKPKKKIKYNYRCIQGMMERLIEIWILVKFVAAPKMSFFEIIFKNIYLCIYIWAFVFEDKVNNYPFHYFLNETSEIWICN